MFNYACELCDTLVEDGEQFTALLTVQEDETYGEGVEGADEICKSCADKIETCIATLRR